MSRYLSIQVLHMNDVSELAAAILLILFQHDFKRYSHDASIVLKGKQDIIRQRHTQVL